jgi:hypothetical protein
VHIAAAVNDGVQFKSKGTGTFALSVPQQDGGTRSTRYEDRRSHRVEVGE